MVVAGKKVLVFGSGISGIGAVKLLEENRCFSRGTSKYAGSGDLKSGCTDRSSDYFKDERKRDSGYRRSGTCIYIW